MKKAATIGLMAVLGSGGSLTYWQGNHQLSPEEVYQRCETGEITGLACSEDVITDAVVRPGAPDPLKVRGHGVMPWVYRNINPPKGHADGG